MQESLGNYVDIEADIRGELFSDHYLKDRLSKTSKFKEITADSSQIFEKLLDIYQDKKDIVDEVDEATLEEEFIRPVLSVLGHIWDVQSPLLSHKGIEEKPDYVLFPNKSVKREALKEEESDKYFSKSIGIVEVKAWGRNLDKGGKRTPSLQIKRYLRLSDVDWGILTNGKIWRLYYKGSSFSSNVYLELDLENILQTSKGKLFKYFYAFFSHDAFVRKEGQSFLDTVYQKNVQFAREVKEDLDENVYKALRELAEGFLVYDNNDLGNEDKDKIHNNCLILLYRLLFLFYAEAKGLIEFTEHSERYSLQKISEDIKVEGAEGKTYAPLDTRYWHRIQQTFKLIDKGSLEALGEEGIPAYNGGLFDADRHPFLETYQIGDPYLTRAIDLLARRESKQGYSSVDYGTLQIKHLGSIYEKLLEYKVRVAVTPLQIKGDKYVEVDDAKSADITKGELYLATDKGERKVTGSYFTPDYVVQYIVENTIGEVVKEKIKKAKEKKESETEAILDINVLDPAMGSGHFLVDATEYLAEELVKAINRDIENDLWEKGGKDIEWAKRKIVQNCIYGVDVNPLATELAKVSLWLTTVAKGKPLSFLDHHLKTGNSLIGADLLDLNQHPEEISNEEKTKQMLLSFLEEETNVTEVIKEMLKPYKKISELPEREPEDIHRKEELYNEVKGNKLFRRLSILSDVHTSYHFGNNFSRQNYEALKNSIMEDDQWESFIQKKWVKEASKYLLKKIEKEESIAEKRKFFHWPLEFPEVFFNLEEGETKEDKGFDVVIGNPPYVASAGRAEISANIEREQRNYFESIYDVAKMQYDLYSLFTERAIDLTCSKGRYGYIVPDSLLTREQISPIREYMLTNSNITTIVWAKKVFEDAQSGNVIFTGKKRKSEGHTITCYICENYDLTSKKNVINQEYFENTENYRFEIKISDEKLQVLDKIKTDNIFGHFCDVRRGEEIGKDSPMISKEGKHPIISGDAIEKFAIDKSKYRYIDQKHIEKDTYYYQEDKLVFRQTGAEIRGAYDPEGVYSIKSVYNVITEKPFEILGISNSKLIQFYHNLTEGGYRDVFPQINQSTLTSLPFPKQYDSNEKPTTEIVSMMKKKVEQVIELKEELLSLNLNLLDFIGKFSLGDTLNTLSRPHPGISDSILTNTTEEHDKLKLGKVEIKEEKGKLVLYASVRYKPDNPRTYQTDRYGYTETEPIPAMTFKNLSEVEKAIVEHFVPLAVDKAGGFANFRKNATKTISLLERLKDLTLPNIENVKEDLKKYVKVNCKAKDLKQKIRENENQIDVLVFKLYDLNKREVKTVLNSLETLEKEKKAILKKF